MNELYDILKFSIHSKLLNFVNTTRCHHCLLLIQRRHKQHESRVGNHISVSITVPNNHQTHPHKCVFFINLRMNGWIYLIWQSRAYHRCCACSLNVPLKTSMSCVSIDDNNTETQLTSHMPFTCLTQRLTNTWQEVTWPQRSHRKSLAHRQETEQSWAEKIKINTTPLYTAAQLTQVTR